jgi:hypothetical protein
MTMSEEAAATDQTGSSEPIREVLVLEQFSGLQAAFLDDEREVSDLSESTLGQPTIVNRTNASRPIKREPKSRCCLLL